MFERSAIVETIRSEIVGPTLPTGDVRVISFNDHLQYEESSENRLKGPIFWRSRGDGEVQEVLYYDGETPHRKYGAGLLYPVGARSLSTDEAALQEDDRLGVDLESDGDGDAIENGGDDDLSGDAVSDGDDFEVVSIDARRPSTMGVSFCVKLSEKGQLVFRFPQSKLFAWQSDASVSFPVNGRYEKCTRFWSNQNSASPRVSPMWRRFPAFMPSCEIAIAREEILRYCETGDRLVKDIKAPNASPIKCLLEVFPRIVKTDEEYTWLLVTAVIRNITESTKDDDERESILYQTYFEVFAKNGGFEKYPESQRPYDQLDPDEKTLALLYRDSATWGIGHGCTAGWDADLGQVPASIYADVMPAVQTPNMTPDIKDNEGRRIELSMKLMAALTDDADGDAWEALKFLETAYSDWIENKRGEVESLPHHFKKTAKMHLDKCENCLTRIRQGIQLLKEDENARKAFRLANLSMLLQQIGSKRLSKRPLRFDSLSARVAPEGAYKTPWEFFQENNDRNDLPTWRAFQIAFLLMSLNGTADGEHVDRETVDLIWFPTGGGKTEAYLGVVSFYLFYQRFLMERDDVDDLKRDGTNVLMRYTLRMLTTQQFQRAASLICSMEYLRRNPNVHGQGEIYGTRFSLGLWIGGTATPNKIAEARSVLNSFMGDNFPGNPFVLTECPWCRAEIGRYNGSKPRNISLKNWRNLCINGVADKLNEGPLLHCPDPMCAFGKENYKEWIPVEVIDERIYRYPPSLVIATVDKFAMIAYRPQAGALFGRDFPSSGHPQQVRTPPGLIIQDELHLISGPLGTMYALYEGVIEKLCGQMNGKDWLKPKIIASTATIRGAADQVKSLYARTELQLYPSPGLSMSDSFFGTYARNPDGKLSPGRLYLGVHGNNYGSVLTTQTRVFSSALFRPFAFEVGKRDPWWSLLVFYNSIRELGGAKTLFDSDIRSRLKFLFNREGGVKENRRNLRIVEELTSRLTQAEIVSMMEKLSTEYSQNALDVCLASNIIEVGVDIDRLSLMGVVGQPKTTAQYIQVTGRVGRKWWERPGLILMIYNPSKSRDRSHYEQFHSYHRRLYEMVEPTSATPFAVSAIQRGGAGALVSWARQHCSADVSNDQAYEDLIESGVRLLTDRSALIQDQEDQRETVEELDRLHADLMNKWSGNPKLWEEFPPKVDGEYLMLWPGQYATFVQKAKGVLVASSMRQVDGNARLTITQGYEIT